MFDPFKDFDTKGYLRNVVGEKDLNIVKQLEHDLFTANLADAMAYLAKKRTITYRDFLQVHSAAVWRSLSVGGQRQDDDFS